jgi:tyramine---L-glutamate ligase
MRIFVFEWVSGGGWFSISPSQPPLGSLLREGDAMLRAVAEDFSAIPDCDVIVQRDARLPPLNVATVTEVSIQTAAEETNSFERLVCEADHVLLIAPEFDGQLYRRAALVEQLGGNLLSPNSRFVALTGDKWCLHLKLQQAGVSVPQSFLVRAKTSLPSIFSYPLVIKPVDGCGSMGVQYLSTPHIPIDWQAYTKEEALVQQFRHGMAASLSVLCGANGSKLFLPASKQKLSRDGRFQYQGGELPLHPILQSRAEALVEQCLSALPDTLGYVGVDLLLGELPEQDCVIEVNPRLTTSYLGLRSLCASNLAEAMWQVAKGNPVSLDWNTERRVFSTEGIVDF